MHEISIIHDAIKIAIENGKINNMKSINKIYMKIGEFNYIDEDALKFAFDILSKDTICQEAELIINKTRGKARCDYCKEDFEITFINKICPNCNKYSNNVLSGYELSVWQIEGE